MKSLVDDLAVTCDEIIDTTENASVNPNDKANYCFIAIVLLAVVCLLLLVVIFVKYHIKHALKIPSLLPY